MVHIGNPGSGDSMRRDGRSYRFDLRKESVSYDEKLAERIAQCLKGKRGITQKKMFGGLCFLLHGNMICGVVKDKLCARVGSEAYEECLSLKHTEPMDFTGKPLKGMVYVIPEGTKTVKATEKWVSRSMQFARTLPRKAS